MKKDIGKYLTVAVFLIVLAAFFVLNRLVVTPAIIESERRPASSFPELNVKNIMDTSFMNGFDSWAQDSFFSREPLRTIRAFTVFHVFFQSDKEGLYIGDAGVGSFTSIDEASWIQSMAKINKMAKELEDLHLYAAVIPDKSIYAGRYFPGFDAETAKSITSDELSPTVNVIDLTESLSSEDFYRTDLHWNQPQTESVMDILAEAMNFELQSNPWKVLSVGTFKGVYAGQIALPVKADTMSYVTNPYIDTASSFYLDPATQAMLPGKIYYPEKLTGGDPYDFFLNGPQAIITLESSEKKTGRTLYLFRDSFGSSLAPLFLGAYDKVVLIDLRYIDSRILPEFVEFEANSDVLFLYSSQILNNPTTLLIN